MDETGLATVAEIGQEVFIIKLVVASIHMLWIYDYLLTLGDEMDYAWRGRKSRVFALFAALRYSPVYYIVWVDLSMFYPSKSLCQETKWLPVLHTTLVTFLTQITVMLRIYGMTEKNKLLGGTLSFIISVQPLSGFYHVVRVVRNPAPPVPEVNLDIYKACLRGRWRLGEFVFASQATIFDVFAFSVIFIVARRPGIRHPGIPSLLDVILRDATVYFTLICASQVSLLLCLCFAPETIQLVPALANTVLTPIMASRLMLSLKKASVEPSGHWCLSTISEFADRSQEDQTLHFALPTMDNPRNP